MAGDPKRAKLISEIIELNRLQMESNREATFGGWTRDTQDDHDRRSDHIGRLVKEMEGLNIK